VHGGLGLGLSIVRYLAEAHGGTVAAESLGRGHGATFSVTLPIGALKFERPPLTVVPGPSAAEPIPQRLSGASILLVDDDREGRMVVRALLRQAGASIIDVESAALALEELAKQLPDLVITDIAMPHVGGYSLARDIRAQTPDLKIVALTAFPAGRSGGHDAIFDAFITKPVEPSELVDAIARILMR
jgi:CheY-like chemotaxis protein